MRINVSLTLEPPTLPPRTRRRLLAALVLGVALAVPGVTLASHFFTDVPDGHTFHTNIANLAGAGITAGCGGTNYCPDASVSRGQMAGFLNRGLGRVAEVSVQAPSTGTGQATLGEFTITPGIPNGQPDGKQFLVVEYDGSVRFTNIANCPCTLAIYLTANGGPLTQVATATTVTTANTYWPISTSGVIQVSGTSPITMRLIGYYVGGATTTTAYTMYGTMTAQTVPFGSTGGSTLSAPAPAAVPADHPLAVPPRN
jgi:hypothetical protein